jgi:hypothetical protein
MRARGMDQEGSTASSPATKGRCIVRYHIPGSSAIDASKGDPRVAFLYETQKHAEWDAAHRKIVEVDRRVIVGVELYAAD